MCNETVHVFSFRVLFLVKLFQVRGCDGLKYHKFRKSTSFALCLGLKEKIIFYTTRNTFFASLVASFEQLLCPSIRIGYLCYEAFVLLVKCQFQVDMGLHMGSSSQVVINWYILYLLFFVRNKGNDFCDTLDVDLELYSYLDSSPLVKDFQN